MNKVWAVLLGVLSVVCVLAATLTAINLGFILTRPDSISVVNTLVGQFVVIVAALVFAFALFRAARRQWAGQPRQEV